MASLVYTLVLFLQAMDITPDKIALRTAEFYETYDITIKTDKEVSSSGYE